MKIAVRGLETDYHISAGHLIRSFFDQADLHFSDEEEADLILRCACVVTDLGEAGDALEVRADIRLESADGEPLYRKVYGERLNRLDDAKEKRKKIKHIINVPLLDVLQRYTGRVQPWGTLTGMRPTKLLHTMLRATSSNEQARERLQSDYALQESKIDLMFHIVDRQKDAIPDLYKLESEVSVYIGIPFCPTKCAYCTFPAYAIGGKQGSVNAFLEGLHHEVREVGNGLKELGVKVTSLYFGGGTPTSITAEEMDALYEETASAIPGWDNIREITVEAGRPDTITREKLDVLRKWNIDRISINPQSYTQATLDAIGRHHTVEETIRAYHLAREMGMHNINMDLIIGLPGEGVEHFRHTLEETRKLRPESLTIHTLSFKRASEMTQNRDKFRVSGREEIEAMMEMGQQWTTAEGYAPYYLYRQKNILGNLENVGYALPGQESLYNILIMEEVQSIVGIGCGAASKWRDPETGKISHYANPKDPRSYHQSYHDCTNIKLRELERIFQPV